MTSSRLFTLAAAAASVAVVSAAPAQAAVAGPTTAFAVSIANGTDAAVETVQYRSPNRGFRGGYGGPRYVAPRAYVAPRGYGPRSYGGPRYVAPAWGYRPWYRRPYYGTIIGGIALGSIIAATAYGIAPRPPRPDLCWYWADEFQSQGYWDYC